MNYLRSWVSSNIKPRNRTKFCRTCYHLFLTPQSPYVHWLMHLEETLKSKTRRVTKALRTKIGHSIDHLSRRTPRSPHPHSITLTLPPPNFTTTQRGAIKPRHLRCELLTCSFTSQTHNQHAGVLFFVTNHVQVWNSGCTRG